MMPVEKWYEYQTVYNKHGIDMKPKAERKAKRKTSKLAARDKAFLFFLVVFMGFLFLSIIITNAYSADIKYAKNQMERENVAIVAEIENLELELNRANNIQHIEEIATVDLGMIKPDNFVYLEGEKQPVKDFALLLKEEAYN